MLIKKKGADGSLLDNTHGKHLHAQSYKKEVYSNSRSNIPLERMDDLGIVAIIACLPGSGLNVTLSDPYWR